MAKKIYFICLYCLLWILPGNIIGFIIKGILSKYSYTYFVISMILFAIYFCTSVLLYELFKNKAESNDNKHLSELDLNQYQFIKYDNILMSIFYSISGILLPNVQLYGQLGLLALDILLCICVPRVFPQTFLSTFHLYAYKDLQSKKMLLTNDQEPPNILIVVALSVSNNIFLYFKDKEAIEDDDDKIILNVKKINVK